MTHNAELLAVGTELLLGNIANTDAQTLSRELSTLGINVFYHTVVGDNPERLKAAVEIAKRRADIIITTGGLGPTCDDLTKVVLAEAFGKKLIFHAPSAERIKAFFERIGREMPDTNLQQAMLPEGCVIFENEWGTAPGCAFEGNGCRVIMLPGPPKECAAMFRYRALPYLQALSGGVIHSRTLRVFGMGESTVESMLREKMNALTNPTLAPYAKEGEVELRITAKADTKEEAADLITPVESEVCAVLGHKIYGADVSSLEEVCLTLLKERGLTLGAAESCTGGLIAKRMTDLPGASAVFMGGVVSYTNEIKMGVLGVSEALLQEHGAVSHEVAEAMAAGARALLGCDLAVATTGVAGPGPDEQGNPAGLVYVALAAPDGCIVKELQAGIGRDRVRTYSASYAFDLVRRYLTGLLQ